MITQPSPCKFCQKKGLPILPIRYGIAPKRAFDSYKFKGSPPDATQLLGTPEISISAPDTVYTGRMLRAGFLYVYYQDHREWEAYAVDNGGCLSRLALTDDAAPAGDRFHDACARDAAKVANASVLTILDPETAGAVWIGFSDAWWTKTIRGKVAHASDAERAKFMRKVDVSAWYSSGTRPEHAFQIYQVDMIVAEYAMPLMDGTMAFVWAAPGGFADFAARPADTLKQQCDALAPAKGLVLELPDPVGIARELPLYMQARWGEFSRPYTRQLQVDADLTQLQQIIERQAQDDLLKKFYFQQNGVESLGDWALKSGGHLLARGIQHVFGGAESHPEVAVPSRLTEASVKKYCADTWKPYAAAIDHDKRKAFKLDFTAKSTAYNDKMMISLAQAHSGWMQSATTKAVFDHHYDPEDINTGVGFSTVFTACVSGTAGMGACGQLYDRWLKEGAKHDVPEMNLLWRALVCNHPELAARIKTVHTGINGGAPKASDGWQSLFATFQYVAGKLHFKGEQATTSVTVQSNVATLTAELGGAMMRVIGHRNGAGNDLLAALGMHAGAPAKVVTVYGTLDDVNRSVFDFLDSLQPRVSQQVKAARMFALSDRLRIINAELASNHINPYDTKIRSWRVVFDDGTLDASAMARMTPEQQARQTVGRLKAVGPGPEEGVVSIDNYATRSIKTLKLPGVASAIMLVFAGIGLNNALGDVHTSLAGTQTQAEAMLASAITGIMGAGFDVVRTSLAAVLERPSMVGPLAGMVNPAWLKFAKAGGAAGGAVAMIIAMSVDFTDSFHELLSGQSGMAVLHGSRGVVEAAVGAQLGLDFLAVCGWEVGIVILSDPAMWVAAIAIIAVGTVITLVEDPKPLKWARACYFGANPDADYASNVVREQSDFLTALAG